MAIKQLEPGQYQLGDLVFGRDTLMEVETADIAGYDVNAQDFQTSASDEVRFGNDSLKPAGIQFTINVLRNFALPNIVALGHSPAMDFSNDRTIDDLAVEWDAGDIRHKWGELKHLTYCRHDYQQVRIYGRPGKFAYRKVRKRYGPSHYVVTAEYRRADTFCYDDRETYVEFDADTPQIIERTIGPADTWIRILLQGPIAHPIINFGIRQIELDWNIPAGVVVEISSYPWARRVIDSNGFSLAAYLVTAEPYLDKLKLQYRNSMQISWTGAGLDANSKMVLLWRDAWRIF